MRPGRWFLVSGVACLLVARMPAGRMPDAGACHMPLGTGFSPGLRLAAERVIDALLGSWRAESTPCSGSIEPAWNFSKFHTRRTFESSIELL